MTYPLAADSKRLRGPAFDPFVTFMRDARGRVLDGAGPPTTVPPRAPIDGVVNLVVPDGWHALVAVIDGLIELPQGDANHVRELAALIEAAEASVTDTATHAFGGHRGHV